MRILYGVQATGNGHITRARAMLPALRAQGIHVDFVFSGRERHHYFDMEAFGRYRCFQGFTYNMHKGRVRWPQTLADARPGAFIGDVCRLDLRRYDWVLTDFEPVSAWAAKLQGVPSVGLAHQYALRYPLPGTPALPLLRWSISAFAPAQYYLGVHWQPFDAPVLPPLIQAGNTTLSDDGFILVYLPFESLTFVCRWLKPFTRHRFRIYAATPYAFDEAAHIEVRPLSRQAFPLDLAHCSGIICNTGFGLCSEAMAAGKKILTRPLQNQIEQQSNATVLQQMGRATVMTDFDDEVLTQWLAQAAATQTLFPDPAPAVAQWLAGGCRTPVQQVADSVWQHAGTAAQGLEPFKAV
ncbi:hypothetical protein LVJ83_00185 [Uruburuella testudinis]|uniref:Glycosyltransferase n=1 Tax=Uruburuella testudinis TaxID=1282863 RepID=A0ABY4DSD0_9NEIS|nr:glycosyltransferase family protein [Uruburuella testudinis]UOO81935.1 hypothetical protein LVJ83_00185 [Uruburuella testudinis]